MQLQLVGYFPKTTAVPAGWSCPYSVLELCSVSPCLAPGPEAWLEHRRHNDLGLFNSPADAWSVVPAEQRATITVFGYRLHPRRFEEGVSHLIFLPELQIVPLTDTYESLGFDVVSKSVTPFFECSPLSCNSMANEVPVKSFCLLDRFESALAIAERFSLGGGVEPGAYHVVEVLRERTNGLRAGA